jgi:hypothetical protein
VNSIEWLREAKTKPRLNYTIELYGDKRFLLETRLTFPQKMLKIIPMSQRTAIIKKETPTQKMPKAFFVIDAVSSQQSAVSSQQSAVSSQQSAVSSQQSAVSSIHIF